MRREADGEVGLMKVSFEDVFDLTNDSNCDVLRISLGEDNKGNYSPHRSNPRYLISNLSGQSKKRGLHMDQPYVVDINGYIMYLDQAPHM